MYSLFEIGNFALELFFFLVEANIQLYFHNLCIYEMSFFQFFTTKPLPCDPSSLPKYPPSKEFDAKLRDEEARRYIHFSSIELCTVISFTYNSC